MTAKTTRKRWLIPRPKPHPCRLPKNTAPKNYTQNRMYYMDESELIKPAIRCFTYAQIKIMILINTSENKRHSLRTCRSLLIPVFNIIAPLFWTYHRKNNAGTMFLRKTNMRTRNESGFRSRFCCPGLDTPHEINLQRCLRGKGCALHSQRALAWLKLRRWLL